jgi:hypothetical protein
MHLVTSLNAWAWFLAHLSTTMAGRLNDLSVVLFVKGAKSAKSGMIRDIPWLFIEDEVEPGVFAIVASNFGQGHNPVWYYNFKVHPQVSCFLRG